MKKILLTALLALAPLATQAQGILNIFTHCWPTNFTVDATNKIFDCTFGYKGITFVNDSTSNIYMTPSGTNVSFTVCTNYLLTASVTSRDPIGGSNIVSTVVTGSTMSCVTNTVNPLVAGQGVRLNSAGGNITYNSTGEPTEHKFQFIAPSGNNGENVCIDIGLAQ